MDLSISWELSELKSLVGRFIDDELAPLEDQIDRSDHVEPDVLDRLRKRAVELGFYGFNLATDVGGGGVGPIGQVLIGEESGRTSMPLSETIGRLPTSLEYASESQLGWLVVPILEGDKTICIALTEPDAGSDLGGVRTRAVLDRDTWVLSGSKQFISHAGTADFIIVLAVTDPEADSLTKRFTAFILDGKQPGLTITNRARKMGWNGYHIYSFSLEEAQVDGNRILGGVGNGFKTMIASINTHRLYIAARCVGSAQRLLDIAAGYAGERETFGQRLIEHQAIQFMLADMDVELEAARSLTRSAAWHIEHGEPDGRIFASRAKLYASEVAGRIADTALQILGGAGYTSDFPVERMYRDLRGYRIGEGSSEMQRIQIARHLERRYVG